MTDNRVTILQDGSESIVANRADRLGIKIIRKMGIKQLILSTKINKAVKAQADKLDLPVKQGAKTKQKI